MYRVAREWNQWLAQPLGLNVLEAEQHFLLSHLATYFGKHAALIGVPQQHMLLKTTVTSYQTLITPLLCKTPEVKVIESDFYELPILSGTIDVVMLPHTLEYLDNPRQLLNEACRIVKPEGHIVILGFNPISLWGLRKGLLKAQSMPWLNRFILLSTVHQWLQLADFELIHQAYILHRPPINQQSIYSRLKFLDWLGHKLLRSCGGIYILVAKAKVIPLIPVRLRWKQTLSGIRATMPGSSMRKF